MMRTHVALERRFSIHEIFRDRVAFIILLQRIRERERGREGESSKILIREGRINKFLRLVQQEEIIICQSMFARNIRIEASLVFLLQQDYFVCQE